MVDSSLYPSSESFYQGLDATGVGNTSAGRSIFQGREEPKSGPSTDTIQAFKDAAVRYNVPADVLMSMAEKDSNFNEFNRSRGPGPKVRGIINVSDDEVARGENGNPYEPSQNINAAAQKLRSYLDAGMSIQDAVKAHVGGADPSKWTTGTDAYAQDVLSRTQRIAETYIPEAAPRVVETETHRDAKGQAVPPTVEEQRQMFGIGDPGRPGVMQQLGEDVQRGTANLANIGRGLKGMAQAAVGDEAGAKATLDEYVKREYLNARENPAIIGSYKNIRTDSAGNFASDAGRYAVEKLGENAAMFLPALATGGIGAGIGRAITERAAVRFIEDQVAKGMTREAAETLAAKMVERGITVGAAAGAAPSTVGMETGSIGGDIYKETGQIRPGVAAVGGVAAGALDLVEPVIAIKKAFGPSVSEPIKDMAIKAIVKRVGVEGLKQLGIEGGTEAVQTVIEKASTRSIDGKQLFTPELFDEVVDSALAGAIGGGVMGVGSQAVAEYSGRNPVSPPVPSQQTGADRREPTLDGSVTTAPEGAAPSVEPQTRPDVSTAATTEAARDLAASAPGRQTVSEVDQPAKAAPATARPGGQGPLSRVLETQAPDVAPLATAAGERVTLSDEMGSLTGAIVSQDADGVLFKSDDGAELLIDNQEIVSGKVSIAKGGEAPVSQAPVNGPETNFGTMPATEPAPAPVVSQEAPAKESSDSDIAEQAVAGITEPPVRFKRTYEDMAEPELRDRMKYIAGQAKAAGGWNKMLIDERKKIEKAINALKAPAPALPENEKPTSAAQPVKAEAQPTKVADEATMKRLLNDYSMTSKAMQAKIDNYGLNDTHEVTQNDKGRFVITPKVSANATEAPAPSAAQEEPEPYFEQARTLIDEQKAASGNAKAEAVVRKKIRALSQKVPQSHAKTVAALDIAATRLDMGSGGKKGIEFAPEPKEPAATVEESSTVEPSDNMSMNPEKIDTSAERVDNANTSEAVAAAKPKMSDATEFWRDLGREDRIGYAKLAGVDPSRIDTPWSYLRQDEQKSLASAINAEPATLATPKIEAQPADKIPEAGKKVGTRRDANRRAQKKAKVAQPPAAPTKPAPQQKLIGENARGNKVYEDEDGVRSYVESGIRVSETVGVIPGGGITIDKSRRGSDFKTRDEIAPPASAPEPATAPTVSENKVFTDDAYAAAVARFNKRHKGASFNSGIDPEDLADGIIMAGYHIEKGARTFSAYAEAMLETLGEKVRPFLKSWYLGVKFDPRGASFDGMDSAGAVEAFDLASLNMPETAPVKKSENYYDTIGDKKKNLFVEMRRLGEKALTYRQKAREFTPPSGTISVGGADFEQVLKAEIIDSYLRALRNGKTPDEALAQAADDRTAYVKNFNSSTRDYHIQRSEDAEQTVLEDVHRSILRSVSDDTPGAPAESVAPAPLVEMFRDKFLNSTEPPFKTIVEARKFAKENGLVADDGKAWTKVVDETIEHGLVLAARQLAETHRSDPKEAFKQIVALYNRQPNLGSRTSESIAEQAYSTPAPLAYVASQIAGISGSVTVLEPTAGNGMLLMEADPKKATANELNQMRREALDAQGFKTSGEDASAARFDADPKVDVVIANPPFGAVKEAGVSKVFNVDGFETTQIDHAISLNALKAMKPDGRAVLIIGGIKAENDAERAKGYMGKAKRTFFYRLLSEYNVTDIFTVSGDLYAKQGAGWPVDVIVIDGKGASSRAPLTKEPPPLLNSWDEVGEKLNEQRSQNDKEARGNIEPGSEQGSLSSAEKPEPASRNDGGGEPAIRGESVPRKPKKGRPTNVGGTSNRGESGPVRAEQPMDAGTSAPSEGRGEYERVDYVPDTERGRPVEANDAGQTPYRPASKKGVSLGTLVPANLRAATAASLDRVQRQYGQIDHFVANELGYEPDELGQYFSAEQVDAIGLGISNIDKGDGFIIGDQTGIGKGRVVAAMISYAKRKGMTPVFVTEKPDLYGDMWRDLHDIGWNNKLGREISIFMTNSGARVPLDEEAVEWAAEAEQARLNGEPIPERRGTFTPAQSSESAINRMNAILSGSENPDVVFTTYDQMNSVKGAETPRRNFLRQIAPKSFLIMDEAHNAGGSGGGEDARYKEKGAPPRSKVFREVVGEAKAVMYSSATYAKSPQVMDLFSRTDMAKAVEKSGMLPELISKGGVPLQQVVSSMLADSGQYLRRERSFEGVTYDPETVPVDANAYGSFTNGLRAVFQFDRAFSKDRKEIAENMAAEMGGGTSKDGSVGDAGASATEFASVMHNIIGQMVLAIKAEKAGQRAVEAIKAGEKPVIALSKTNESFIKDFVTDQGLKVGDSINLSFGDILKRYLERTRRITLKTGANEKKHVMIPLSEMGSHAESFNRVMQQLEVMELGALPVSPIDAIRNEIEKAGYSVREITGRSYMVDYTGSEPVLKDRPRSEQGAAGKRVSVKAFNDGKVDALILNKSGSTGISMHASSKFKDQRKRRMILVEADPNIDTHMQMLGRVHRTGQVLTPAYTQLAADIPAEVRPTANLMRKMASLNANTTGAKKSKFSSEAVDFMNKYGDRVVAEVLRDDPDTNYDLGEPIDPYAGEESLTGAVAKVTGRLTLLDPPKQQELLDRITANYSALIERLDAEGANDLEAKSIDLQAKVLESSTVKTPSGTSPFQGAVSMDKVSIKSQGRAMEPAEVLRHVAEALGVKLDGNADFATDLKDVAATGEKKHTDLIEKNRLRAIERLKEETAALKEPEAKENAKKRLNDNFRRWRDIAQMAYPGAIVNVQFRGQEMPAVVIGFDQKGEVKNPVALSSWTLSLALPDSTRSLGVPLSQVFTPSDQNQIGQGVSISPNGSGRFATQASDIAQLFEAARKEGRETRFMFSGNILAAYDQTKGQGQIINHTMEDGSTRAAILMNRTFSPEKFMGERAVRFKTGEQVLKFLDQLPRGEVSSTDGVVTIRSAYNGRIEFDLPSAKSSGGKYFADSVVRNVYDAWEKRGSRMRATVSTDKARQMIDAMMSIDAVFETKENQKEAEAIIGGGNPAEEAPKASIGSGAGMTASDLRDTLTRGVDGPIIKVMLDSGKVVIEATGEGMPAGAQAITLPDGTIRLAASNLDASTARGVLLHEVFHSGGEALVGQDNWKALLRRVQTAADNAKPGSWMAGARARVGVASDNAAEEIAAYAIENAENAPAGIREIADRLVGAVKAYVLRRFGKQFGAVTPGQLRALAIAALRSREAMSATRTVDRARYSMASSATPAPATSTGSVLEKASKAASDLITSAMLGKGTKVGNFSSLSLVPVRALFTELSSGMPSARNYIDTKQAMDQFRNEMNTDDDALAQKWLKASNKNKATREENQQLMKVMHLSTVNQYDPSPEMKDKNDGPNKTVQDAYDALPEWAKEIYSEVRDAYTARADAVEKQVIDNVQKAIEASLKKAERKYNSEMQRIKDEGLIGDEKIAAEKAAKDALEMTMTRGRRNKAARLKRMRALFESNRLKGPYFPLARFGNFYVTLRNEDGKVISFEKFESRSAQRKRADELRNKFGEEAVFESAAKRETSDRSAMDAGYAAEIDSILEEANVDLAVRDEIYQAYLETMPDLSMRKARIHRKGTEGYDKDAVRAFASNMFHSAHQLARLRYNIDLQNHLEEAATEIHKLNGEENVRAQAVWNEMEMAHEFAMNPEGSSVSNTVTSAVFLWTMALNISTAVVNTMQTVNVGIPNLAFDIGTKGKVGLSAAAKEIGRAIWDYGLGGASVLKSPRLTKDEVTAVEAAYSLGLIDSTQAHDLAGVADNGVYESPLKSRIPDAIRDRLPNWSWSGFMRLASLPMHVTEKFNREVTFLAAYRLAKSAGLSHGAAVRKASDQTWATHFDNQSSAKPRFARGDLGKIAFALKSYQANVVFRVFRDLHQALQGKTEEDRSIAIKRFASMFVLTSAAAGIRGAFFYSTVMAIAGAFMGMMGKDDDDPDEIFRRFVIDSIPDAMIGHAVSGMILDGVPGYLTGTNLTNRAGMADMWLRSNDRDNQTWGDWAADQVAPIGLLTQFGRGLADISKGNVERGVEKLVPSAVKNPMKAVRYAREGVTDKDGNPIVEKRSIDEHPWSVSVDFLKQAIGFTPAEIADRYARNTYQRNIQDRIKAKATEARQSVARARMVGDEAAEAKAQKKVDAFNDRYPEYAIRPKSIIQSMRNMQNRSDRMEFGVDLDPKLAERVKGGTAPSIYAR